MIRKKIGYQLQRGYVVAYIPKQLLPIFIAGLRGRILSSDQMRFVEIDTVV